MPGTSTATRPAAHRLAAAAVVAVAGFAVWIGIQLFEELVTADLRWGLWTAGAALLVLAAQAGARRLGPWAPLLLAGPISVLYAIPLVADLPALWPFVPLWLGSAGIGWWLGRRGGRIALLAFALLVAAMATFGGLLIPRTLAAELNVYTDEPAPEIALSNLDGSPYPMETLGGKVVVLDFFATWCIPCRAELPEVESVRRALSGRDDIAIFVVGDGDSGDTLEQVRAFAASTAIDLPFLWDEGGRAHDAFGFANIPALAVIDREGRVRLKRVGFNAAETGFAEDLRRLLESL